MTVRVRGPPLYPLNKNNNDINQNTNYKVKYGTKNHNTNINSHYQINNELKSYGHFRNQNYQSNSHHQKGNKYNNYRYGSTQFININPPYQNKNLKRHYDYHSTFKSSSNNYHSNTDNYNRGAMYVGDHGLGRCYGHQSHDLWATKRLYRADQGQTPDGSIWRRKEKKRTHTNARKSDTVSDKESKSNSTIPDNKTLKSDTVSEELDISDISVSQSYSSRQEDRRPDSKSHPDTDSGNITLLNTSDHSNINECKNNNYNYSNNRERNNLEEYKDIPKRTRNIII